MRTARVGQHVSVMRLHRADAGHRERMVRALTAALETEPDVEFAWLHGSFHTGGAFHDVDVGVHLAPAAGRRPRPAMDLAVRLGDAVRLPVDVRVLNDAPVAFLFHVFRAGRLLLCRDDERLADLMERTVREYLDRAPLLRRAAVEAFGA